MLKNCRDFFETAFLSGMFGMFGGWVAPIWHDPAWKLLVGLLQSGFMPPCQTCQIVLAKVYYFGGGYTALSVYPPQVGGTWTHCKLL